MTGWIAGSAFRGTVNIYDGVRQVAVVGTSIAPDEDLIKREAAVIAAAPDLLEALQHALEMRQFISEAANSRPYEDGPSIQSCWSEVDAIEAIIRAAIAKATGQ